MQVSYVGNFDPSWSTENHIARALENLGHTVQRIPEQRLEWLDLPTIVTGDFLLWTRTGGFDPPDHQRQIDAVKAVKVPVIGYHLDRWWGLNREATERGPAAPDASPWFWATDFICTADGGHDWKWKELGIKHYWFPPAILSDETDPGTYSPPHRGVDVAFVGNLQNYGHTEWAPYRRQLYSVLKAKYGNSFQVYPRRGQKQVRGRHLADLYATVPVLIGDSCLVGEPERYWSDRIPETTGRGGYLIHPFVEGLQEQHPDLMTYPLGDFERLTKMVDAALEDSELRQVMARRNCIHTKINHTYEVRMQRLISLL